MGIVADAEKAILLLIGDVWVSLMLGFSSLGLTYEWQGVNTSMV